MNELGFMSKSLGLDLYKVQDQFIWGRLTLDSALIYLG